MGVDYFNTDCCGEILDDVGDYGRRDIDDNFICYHCFKEFNGEAFDANKHCIKDEWGETKIKSKFSPVIQEEIKKAKEDKKKALYVITYNGLPSKNGSKCQNAYQSKRRAEHEMPKFDGYKVVKYLPAE